MMIVRRLSLFLLPIVFFVLTTFAIKPVRNLHVSFRDEVYKVDDVSTVEELVKRIGKQSGVAKTEIKSGKYRVLYKGNVLEKDQNLNEAGVSDGSNLIVVTDNYPVKAKDILAVILESLDEEKWENLKEKLRNDKEVSVQEFLSEWKEMQYLTRHDVSDFLRNGLDLSYHALRAFWENPSFRLGVTDPNRLEEYRKVVSLHLSKKILGEETTKIVQDKDRWRQQVLKITTGILKLGDTILDGLLDLLLDVLNGAGKTAAAARTRDAAASHLKSQYHDDESTIATLEDDPFLANNLLFELSESEGED